jgi:O-acetyl-ADP-ribose deacetylase (regulator of RNase III)
MIECRQGNLLTSGADVLVNPVNCVGPMDRGLARQFALDFPENCDVFARAQTKQQVQPGKVMLTRFNAPRPWYIANFPTRRSRSELTRLSDIERGLRYLARQVEFGKIVGVLDSVAIPALGCGSGGLDWAVVKKCIFNTFAGVDARVLVFDPFHP